MKFIIKLIFLLLICSGPLFAEYVFLKNGTIITGKIINETADFIIVRDENKKDHKVSQNDILRTVFKDVYLGKQLIQMTSGKRFEAYLVHEDRKVYNFRNELNLPEEFSIERDKVLYMSRNNPTDLTASVQQKSVNLEWKAPYRAPKKYNIYMKSQADKDFKNIGESYNSNYEVKGLAPKTLYSFIVKGLDGAKESLPTNEVQVKTTIPPEKPFDIDKSKDLTPDKKEMSITLKWKVPQDKDGKVVKYIIYEVNDDGMKKIGETAQTVFTVLKLNPKINYIYLISAIDDDGAESDLPKNIAKKRFGLTFTGAFALPVIPNNTTIQPGFNIGLHADYRFLYSGIFYMSGIIGGTFTMHSNPVTASAKKNLLDIGAWGGLGFGLRFTSWFGLELKTMGGYVYSILDNRTANTQIYSNDGGLNAILQAQFYVMPNLVLTIDVGYLAVFYINNIFHDMHFGGGIGFRL